MFARKAWYTPPLSLLQAEADQAQDGIIDPAHIACILGSVGAACSSAGYAAGAQIVTYHMQLTNPADFVRVNRAVKCLAAELHMPCSVVVSDRASFAVQVAREDRRAITLLNAVRCIPSDRTPTTSSLGTDENGQPVIIDIAKLPHMLIAGATGSGKSVALNTLLCSMLYSCTPSTVQFILIDPKQVELSAYSNLPHLAGPIITSPKSAIDALERLNGVMDGRYKFMARRKVKDVSQTDLPRIIVVIDELADLMLTSKRAVEESIIRIAQLGRAAGIHLIIATQKPVVSVVTGLIQGNIPCKLALQTASTSDSVRILGHKGAESLLGKGDALLKLPDRVGEIRLQCAYTSGQDVEAVVNYWKHNAKR